MRTTPRWGLSAWLALLVLGTVLPLLLFAGATLRELFLTSRAASDRGQVDTTQALAFAVDGEVRSWRAALQALAEGDDLRAGRWEEFDVDARAVAAQHDGWVVVNDASGQQRLNTLLPVGAQLPKTAAPDMVQAVFRDGKPLTGLVFGAVAQRYVISNSIPVFREGKVVLCLSLNFSPERLTRLLEEQKLSRSWVVAMLDQENRIVTRVPKAEERIGKQTHAWLRDAAAQADGAILTNTLRDGREARIAFQRLKQVPWVLTVAIPVSELPSPRPLLAFLLIGGLLAGVAVGVTLVVARTIARPIRHLAHLAPRLVHGQAAHFEVPSRIPEVQQLQQALVEASAAARAHAEERERAADALARANEALEARIEERTGVLAKTNEALQAAIASLEDEIEHRIRAEEGIRSVAKFPSENPNPVLRLDADGRILFANAAAAGLLQQWENPVGSPAPAPWPEISRRALASGSQTIVELVCGERTYAVSVVPVAEAGYVNLYSADITVRKQAEEALRESREDLNRAQAVAQTGSWRLDTRRNFLQWSDETYRIFGITPGTPLTYETFLRAVHPPDRHSVNEAWRAAAGGVPYDIEHRIVVSDAVKWVREKAELEFDKDGVLVGGFGTVQDITERKLAELGLRNVLATMEARLHERTVQPAKPRPAEPEPVLSGSPDIGTLGQDVGRRAEELVALDRIAQALGSSLELDVLLPPLLAEVRRLLDAEAAGIILLEPGQETLSLVAADGAAIESLRGMRVPLADSLAGQVLRARQPMLVNDVEQDPRVPASFRARTAGRIRSMIFVPLLCKGQGLGILGVANRRAGTFVPDHLRTLSLIASAAAVAIDNARMFDEVQRSEARLERVSRRLVEIQEEERRAVARELHDEIGQALTALRLILGMATGSSVPQQDERWTEAQALVTGLLSQVRELSLNLRPAVLDDLGLLPALLWHCERLERQTGLRVKLEHMGLEGRRFPATLETAVFRTVQEALTNVVRHAGVQEAIVRAWVDAETLGANIEDQGLGFDVEATLSARQSTGLSSIRERATLLDGKVSIESRPGAGTRITVEFRLPEAAPAAVGDA